MTPIEASTGAQTQDIGPALRTDGPNVLLVDDDAQLLSANARILAKHGYGVETAKDAETALLALRRTSFDVLVSDITMPRVSGIQLVEQIRADGNDIPVVLMTGDPHLDTAIGAIEHGVTRYLKKPVERGGLVRAVGQAVRLQEIARANRLTSDNRAMGHPIEELKRATIAAEIASRAKGEFLSKMSHELRTPVNAIIGMTGLALDTELTIEQREYLTAVAASTGSLLGIIEHILAVSALD